MKYVHLFIGCLTVCIGCGSKGPTYHAHEARYWIRLLGDSHTRHATAWSPNSTEGPTQALRAIGPAAVPVCMEVLREGHGLYRTPDEYGALVALGLYGPDSVEADPLLVQALPKDLKTGHLAAVSLGEIGPAARAVIPELRKQMEDTKAWIKLPSEKKTSSPDDPRRTDNTSDWAPRLNAALALVKIDPGNELALHTLGQALKAQGEVSLIATLYLGEIGVDAKPVLPDLLERLQWEKEHSQISSTTADALKKIDPDGAAAELARLGYTGILSPPAKH